MTGKDQLIVMAGNSNLPLASEVAEYLGTGLGRLEVSKFPDDEINIKVNQDVRGADVFVIQSTCPPANENLMELLIIIDCLRRSSVERITAVIPYFGYARQDRKAEGRVPITAKLVANILTVAGAHRVLTMDLHASQIQGFFDIPLDHLFASPVMIDYLKKLRIPDLVIVSPDVGGVKMARAYAKRLEVPLAVVDKRRLGPDKIEAMQIIGEVAGKNILMVDDIVSTGTSICEAAKVLKQAGAKDIYISITHPILCSGAVEKLQGANIKQLIVTNTIPVRHNSSGFVKQLSIAGLLGEAIKRIHRSESVSVLFV